MPQQRHLTVMIILRDMMVAQGCEEEVAASASASHVGGGPAGRNKLPLEVLANLFPEQLVASESLA